jgi:hypothetical protein
VLPNPYVAHNLVGFAASRCNEAHRAAGRRTESAEAGKEDRFAVRQPLSED